MKTIKRYYWVALSNDENYDEMSRDSFRTKKDAYENMRKEVLNKMTWNTDYLDFESKEDAINYYVRFTQDEIVHSSYSGVYVYRIVEVEYKYEDYMLSHV